MCILSIFLGDSYVHRVKKSPLIKVLTPLTRRNMIKVFHLPPPCFLQLYILNFSGVVLLLMEGPFP